MFRAKNQFCYLLIFILVIVSGAALAQDEEAPKVDVFVGYQWLNPGVTVPTSATSPVPGAKLPSMAKGLGATATYNFSKIWGLSVDGGGNWHDIGHETTLSIGPRVMWRGDGLNLFAHTMLGLNQLKAGSLDSRNSLGAVLGGGMDIPLWHGIYWRVFEADYVWAALHYSDVVPVTDPGLRRPDQNGVRLRSGLVFSYGGKKPEPMTAACSVQPTEVMVGEPITATATVNNANPKHTLAYDWSSSGERLLAKATLPRLTPTALPAAITPLLQRLLIPK